MYKAVILSMICIAKCNTIYRFFDIFLSEFRVDKIKAYVSYVIFGIISMRTFLLYGFSWKVIAIDFITMMLISCALYTGSRNNKIHAALMGQMLCVCMQLAVMILFNYRTYGLEAHIQVDRMFQLFFITILLHCAVEYLRGKINIKEGVSRPAIFGIHMLILIGMSVILFYVIYVSHISIKLAVISMFAIFTLDIVTVRLYDAMTIYRNQQIEIARMVEQNHSYESQIILLTAYMEQTKRIRHDLKNHMGALYQFMFAGKFIEAEKYIENLIEATSVAKWYVNTGNIPLDAIINYKCTQAAEREIHLDLNMKYDKKTKIETIDFMTIFGNLMDNAMEAVNDIETEKVIKISIIQQFKEVYIKVENPYKDNLIRKNNTFITTKEKKEQHGIGLESVNTIIRKYNGAMKIDSQNGTFSVNIVLCV